MNMTMLEQENTAGGLESFVPMPRHILSDYRHGLLSRNELIAYVFMRISVNPYGVATVSLEALRNDFFPDLKDVNYINKLLLELRRKKYIHYKSRQGRRGSFEVDFGELVLPNKQIKTLDQQTGMPVVRSRSTTVVGSKSEPALKSDGASQKFWEQKNQIGKGGSQALTIPVVRSAYTDTQTENEKENILSRESTAYKEKIPVVGFMPKDLEEERCWAIAKYLEELSMDFVLSVLREHGIGLVERAFGLLREEERSTHLNKPAAYFNSIVKKLISEKQAGVAHTTGFNIPANP